MRKHKVEFSLAVGLAVMLLCCALTPHAMQWWSVAFSPLCGGVLTAPAEGYLLRSKLWELLLAP